MTRRRYVQLDVFASRAGDGNPLAVVLDAEGLDDARMQAIARWTRLPETTFVLPPVATDATHRIRIFAGKSRSPAIPASAPRMPCWMRAWPRRATDCWCRTGLPASCR